MRSAVSAPAGRSMSKARRRISSDYPPVIEAPLAASLIDRERHQLYAASGTKLTSDFYLTFSYLLPEDRTVSASRYLFQNQPPTKNRPLEEQIAVFQETVQQITDLLSPILPMLEPLDDQETLTYLHSCVSFRPVSLRPPEGVQLIDSFLYDTDLLPGLAPRLGDRWLKMLGVLGFPAVTMPALLDRLNGLPIEYRWTSRFLFMDKTDAEAELGRLQRQWFAKRKSLGRLLIEMISKEESGLINTDALNKAADANDALDRACRGCGGLRAFHAGDHRLGRGSGSRQREARPRSARGRRSWLHRQGREFQCARSLAFDLARAQLAKRPTTAGLVFEPCPYATALGGLVG